MTELLRLPVKPAMTAGSRHGNHFNVMADLIGHLSSPAPTHPLSPAPTPRHDRPDRPSPPSSTTPTHPSSPAPTEDLHPSVIPDLLRLPVKPAMTAGSRHGNHSNVMACPMVGYSSVSIFFTITVPLIAVWSSVTIV